MIRNQEVYVVYFDSASASTKQFLQLVDFEMDIWLHSQCLKTNILGIKIFKINLFDSFWAQVLKTSQDSGVSFRGHIYEPGSSTSALDEPRVRPRTLTGLSRYTQKGKLHCLSGKPGCCCSSPKLVKPLIKFPYKEFQGPQEHFAKLSVKSLGPVQDKSPNKC